jgi:hypothetical protein
MRSLPEKTFEHWASLYLASRFANTDQWWPTQGEDISFVLSQTLTRPGKILLLEVKVPEVTNTGHTLSIRTKQLAQYLNRGLPVFYVFPVPIWDGVLNPGQPLLEPSSGWWRQRSADQWFGNWTYVLPAADVAAQVNMKANDPVLYSVPNGHTLNSALPRALTSAFPWQDFWSRIQACGPEGTVRWRISYDGADGIRIRNLANDEQLDIEPLRTPMRIGRGERNLAILHIDETDLHG